MLSFLAKFQKSQARQISDLVKTDLEELFDKFNLQINARFKEIEARLIKLDRNLELLETRLTTKEISDKQTYGHLSYKMAEISNQKMKKEVNQLRDQLEGIRRAKIDQ